MPPDWLTAPAWVWIGLAFVSVLVIVVDIARGYRQPMILGFSTSYPANAWLIRAGVKESM